MEKLQADIQRAIADLRDAARIEKDEARGNVADWFDSLFVDAVTRQGLRSSAREALKMYRGGYNSFSDYGSQLMKDALEPLETLLRRAARRW